MKSAQAVANQGKRGKVGRASQAPGQLWQVPMFLLGLAAFAGVAFSAPLRQDTTRLQVLDDMATLRKGLEPGQEKSAVLVAQAENLLARVDKYSRYAAEIHFLAGSAYFRHAAQCPKEAVDAARTKTIHHLEEALALKAPPEDLPPLTYRLGLMLYQQGKEPQRAIDLMAEAVDKGADEPSRGYGVLVKAYLELSPANLEAALAANLKQMELTDDRHVEDMTQARLRRAELLLRKGQRQEALKELDRINPAAPKEMRLQARLLQARLCEEEGLWTRAIPVWQELLTQADKVPGGKGRILYALGLCYISGEPARTDKAVEAWKEAASLGGEEGQAAALRLGELYLAGGAAEAQAVLDTWTKALENVRIASDYDNKLLGLDKARDLFDNACRYYLENQEYERTQQIAELYKKIAPAGVAEERLAQAAEAFAHDLKEAAQDLAGPEAKTKLEEARTQFRKAGAGYEQAASVRSEEGQAEVYWLSARCYLAAKDFSRAGTVLDKFVNLGKDETRLAEAWLELAQVQLAQNNKERARAAYYKCIEFPQTPFAFRARYQLALEEIDKKNYEQARSILKQNLENPSPTLDREAHELSLYKMGRLMLQMQNYDQACLYLKEATRQYPQNPDVLEVRQQLADAYRKLAEQAKKKLDTAQGDDAKSHHQRTRGQWLEQAAAGFQGLADELEAKGRSKALSDKDRAMLRSALFGAADLRFDLNDFPEALRRYQLLQEKYPKQVEGLIACQRIWRCVGVMVETPEQAKAVRATAIVAIKRAQDDLDSMPANSPAFDGGMGVWRKEDWQTWLRWVSDQLSPPTKQVRPGPIVD